MRLSDVGKAKTKTLYLNHSTSRFLTEVATGCSNRLLGCRVCRNQYRPGVKGIIISAGGF